MTLLKSRVSEAEEIDELRRRVMELEENARHVRSVVRTLYYWSGGMSYNDSYVGEPPGFIKSTMRQLAIAVDKP